MSPKEWLRVKEVVADCLEIDASDRIQHLDRICGDDAELRREALSILAANEDAGEFLQRPAISAPEAGMRLGPWRLEGEVGSGGMGRIYRASRADGVYAQKAAVKVLRRGMDTDLILSHFQAERQILASLNHPHIARLLDGGATPDGRPFFVMEFIDGQPLDRWVAGRKPPLEECLRLFQLVCGAVQYAHQRLVVHRDIKPANILVTGEGVPKLVDFGIAKLMDRQAEVTLASERMLTPAYASPEQLAGEEVTTASDIYSLGVVLRELAAPTARRGDLDNIVEKALEPDAARRYGSVAQLAEDIGRYLAGLPVEARKQTLLYRTARFIRRNRLLAGAALLVVVTLAGGLGATLWQYRIARFERRQAQDRFEKVRRLANAVIHELHDSIADLPGATEARALMLSRALEYLDGLAGEAGDDVALKKELAAAYQRVGDVQGGTGRASLGRWTDAERSYNKAIALLDGVPGAEAALAQVLIRAGGEANTERAVAIAGRLGRRGLLADALFAQAGIVSGKGDMAQALAIRLRDLEIRRQLLAEDPRSPGLRGNVALVSKRVGGLLIRMKRLDEAYAHYAAAEKIEREWVAADPLSVEARTALSFSTGDIGLIRVQQKRYPEALSNYRETIALREALFAADEKNFRARTSLTSIYWRTGNLLVDMGRAREAVPLLERAEAILPADPRTFAHREELANLRFTQGRAYGKKSLLLQAETAFTELSREAPGRDDLRIRLEQVRQELAAKNACPGHNCAR